MARISTLRFFWCILGFTLGSAFAHLMITGVLNRWLITGIAMAVVQLVIAEASERTS